MQQDISSLLKSIDTIEIINESQMTISALTADSRNVIPGAMFVAIRGTGVDGHDFINKAIDGGATAIVCEQLPSELDTKVMYIRVASSSWAMGMLASQWFGNPSKKLTLVGVTGTNGKTTIATLLYRAMSDAGIKSGLLSTVENRIGDTVIPATHTTGDQMEINELMSKMVDEGCEFAAMEVSSHGADQNRIVGLDFDGAIFTNLTRDHLDYHKTVAAYIKAKKKFFDNLKKGAFALVNDDDANGRVMVQNTRADIKGYSLRTIDDFTAKIIETRIDSTSMKINGHEMVTRFTGRFNVYNLTAVYGALVLLGWNEYDAAIAVSRLTPVCGRFETFTSSDGVTVVIDYAHTPDALANVLSSISDTVKNVAITTVTGAGGNRDHGKRPLMGAEAARYSKRVIITSDNPRDEDPADIAADIIKGIPTDAVCHVDTILDRATAISTAIGEAHSGDVVLVAGKGHETYQIFAGGRTIHFDDHQYVKDALAARDNKK